MRSRHYLDPNDVDRLKIADLSVFDDLPTEDLENLIAVCQHQAYQPDEYIIKAGSLDPWLYILLHGKAAVNDNDIEITVIHERGALFGEAALIDQSPRRASVIAQTQCACLAIDTVLMQEVLCTTNLVLYAHFYKHINQMLSRRLAKTSEELSLVKLAFQQILVTTQVGPSSSS